MQILNDNDVRHLQLAVGALISLANEWQPSVSEAGKRCVLNVGRVTHA